MRMPSWTAGAVVVAAVALIPASAPAAKPSCAKLAKARKGRDVRSAGGVTVWRVQTTLEACRKGSRTVSGVYSGDPGLRITRLTVSAGRLVAVTVRQGAGPQKLVLTDLLAKNPTSLILTAGTGGADGTIDSVALASNGVAAWGETADGGSVRRIRAQAFTARNDVLHGITEVATVPGADDTRHVGVTPNGRLATVTWTVGGARQQQALGRSPYAG